MNIYYQIEGYLRNNIGDVLQGMVAKAFIPSNPQVADREALADIDNTKPAMLIANGWYLHTFEKFPAPDNVTPVYLAVHLAESKLLTDRKIREHFKKHAPIGCRDKKTLKLFLGWGIPAYYSSCLTITASPRAEINNSGSGEVLLVDNVDHPVPTEVKEKLEKLLGKSLIRISHDPPNTEGSIQEYAKTAEEHMNSLLERYCKAALVITTKIHCALPSLGMGANVMLIHPRPEDHRLGTLAEFTSIISYKEVLTSDNIEKPKVHKQVLNKRKKFLSEIVEKSIRKGHNILQSPDTAKLKLIKLKSMVLAIIYRLVIKGSTAFGIGGDQMKRIFTSKN